MFDKHVWKFHDPRSIDKKVRGGGVKITPPPALKPTAQIGGGGIFKLPNYMQIN